MDDREPSSQELADQRAAERADLTVSLRLSLAAQELAGVTCDASRSGVMFTSGEHLRVEVEIEEDGVPVTRTGRIVRVQRVNAGEVAYAVELDAD
jgi:hypothetical protein